ncbi:LD-carboxypeptidase [Drancourtella sp. An177]|nr:LD-carboxypeptidase [Drancourtella sp. An177]
MCVKKGDKVAIVGCSNGQSVSYKEKLIRLDKTIRQIGLIPVWGDYIYEKESVFSGSANERADSLMKFFRDDEIKAVFDISGGDIANEILPYLEYDEIAQSEKVFWGYSDLTTVINAIFAKSGKKSVLYQIRNLIYDDAQNQIQNFTNTVMNGASDLFDFSYSLIQEKELKGIVVGGNIRCLLKLAGTKYWPDMDGKVLLLEAYGGDVPKMVTYLNQLKQMEVFEKISGILLGTFTYMEKEKCRPQIIDLVRKYAGNEVAIAYTSEIGHGTNSKGIIIGEEISKKGAGYRK